MSGLTCSEIRSVARGETNKIYLDWGENTAAEKTGGLSAGDTVATCVVSVDSKPANATDPTLGTVTVPTNSSSDDINGRIWSTGEATVCVIQTASDQTLGPYRLKFTATTTNGYVLPRFVRLLVGSGS